jgi:GTPase SAR1 family protein
MAEVDATAAPTILRCKVCIIGDAGVGKTALTEVCTKGNTKFPKSYNMTATANFVLHEIEVEEANKKVELCIFDIPGQNIYRDTALQFVRRAVASRHPAGVGSPRDALLLVWTGGAARWGGGVAHVAGAAGVYCSRPWWLMGSWRATCLQCEDAAAVIVVYDVSNEMSFENCAMRMDELLERQQRQHIRGVLVANKCDLASRVFGGARERGMAFAQQYGLAYYETTGMENDNAGKADTMVEDCAKVEAVFEHVAKDFCQSYEEYKNKIGAAAH